MSIPPSRQAKANPGLYPHHFTIYLDDESAGQVRAYAARSKVRLAVALRELIEFGLESVNDHADA